MFVVFIVAINAAGGLAYRDLAKRGFSNQLGDVVRPMPTVSVRPTIKPTATPAPTLRPTPTSVPPSWPSEPPVVVRPVISKVEVFDGTSGESTYGYVTGVKVTGQNIGLEARMRLASQKVEYTGMYQGGDRSTWILTDFLGLPHCQTYHVIVTGDNGTAIAKNTVETVCP